MFLVPLMFLLYNLLALLLLTIVFDYLLYHMLLHIFNFKFMETNLKDLQSKTRILTLGGARYYGKEKDRNTTITIEKK